MKRAIVFLLTAVMVAALALVGGCSSSQPPAGQPAKKEAAPAAKSYPKGSVTFLIPNAAGGGNDLTTRAMIPSLQRTLGVTVVPSNKGESKGAIAANSVMTAVPDGQTLYFNSQTLILMPYGGMANIKMEEFQPVAQVVEDTGVIFVKSGSSFDTIEKFVTAAKKDKLKVAHNGVGSLWHLAAIQLAQTLGADFQYVAYTQGGAPMMTALAAGEVDMCIVNPSEAKALVDANKIKPIAVMSSERLQVYANTPTLKESKIDMTFPVWRGVFTKKGTSEEVLNELDKAFAEAVKSPEFIDYCKVNSLPIKFRNHKEFSSFFTDEIKKYEKIMKAVQ